MRRSISRWLDWTLSRARQSLRRSPRLQKAIVRHRKAGLTFEGHFVPWNADTVEVEAICRLPATARRRSDFTLRFANGPVPLLESMLPSDEDTFHLHFRFPPLAEATTGELFHKSRRMATITVPMITTTIFTTGVQVKSASLAMKLGRECVSAPRFVARQCRGFVATAVISSPTPLAPLADGDVHVLFRHERTKVEHRVPVRLSRSQLKSREASVTAVLPMDKVTPGPWLTLWVVNGVVKSATRVEGVTWRKYCDSLRVLDSKFVVADRRGEVELVCPLPPPGEMERFGPCFLIASGDPGIAGRCRLTIHAVSPDHPPTCIAEEAILLTDAASIFAPVLVDVIRYLRCTGFELRMGSRALSTLSLSPVPRATLTAEGGFKAPAEFAWSSAAEEELQERLERLMKGPLL